MVSKAQKLLQIINSHKDKIFDNESCRSLFEKEHKEKISEKFASNMLHRFYKKKIIFKSQRCFARGYKYSSKNQEILEKEYLKFALPYEFDNREEILNQMFLEKFESLNNRVDFPINTIKNNEFVKKYGIAHFKEKETQNFLTIIIGFVKCDGFIKWDKLQTGFCFRYEKDALLFKKDFEKIFPKETISVSYRSFCYVGNICGKSFGELLETLGAPVGKKINQEFCIPNWIYYGNNDIKRAFISIAIGNEGSAPSNRYKRIQFVLSKTKQKVPNLLYFVNQLRTLLFYFGIKTMPIQLRTPGGNRKFNARFYIIGLNDLKRFHNQFKFLYASEKQESLNELIKDKYLK